MTTDSGKKDLPTTDTKQTQQVDKHITQRAGGRHLVFRINRGPWWFLPRPYALISNIEGSIMFFYGAGQIWATHRKSRRINDWIVRCPRFISLRIQQIVDELEGEISDFIQQLSEQDLIGTIIVERRVIEFHWTVPRSKHSQTTHGTPDNKSSDSQLVSMINEQFNNLALAFAQLQLAGKEGAHDVNQDEIEMSTSTVPDQL